MPKRSSLKDEAQLANSIVDGLTADDEEAEPKSEKNPAAVALGKLGGKVGGKARAETLSAKRRKEIARKAAVTRWAKTSE